MSEFFWHANRRSGQAEIPPSSLGRLAESCGRFRSNYRDANHNALESVGILRRTGGRARFPIPRYEEVS